MLLCVCLRWATWQLCHAFNRLHCTERLACAAAGMDEDIERSAGRREAMLLHAGGRCKGIIRETCLCLQVAHLSGLPCIVRIAARKACHLRIHEDVEVERVGLHSSSQHLLEHAGRLVCKVLWQRVRRRLPLKMYLQLVLEALQIFSASSRDDVSVQSLPYLCTCGQQPCIGEFVWGKAFLTHGICHSKRLIHLPFPGVQEEELVVHPTTASRQQAGPLALSIRATVRLDDGGHAHFGKLPSAASCLRLRCRALAASLRLTAACVCSRRCELWTVHT